MFENTIFENISIIILILKKLLNSCNTLIIVNSNNINLKIKSKINKIMLQNCKNVNINVN